MAIKMPSAEQTAMARRKLEQAKQEEALHRLQEQVKSGQGDALVHYQLGVAYLSLGQPVEAIQALKKSIEIDERFIHAWVNLAIVHHQMGEFDKSVEMNRRALEIAPGFVPARVNLGLALNGQGRYNESIKELAKVLKIEPEMPQALAGLYEAHLALKHADEAQRFRKLAEKSGVRFVE